MDDKVQTLVTIFNSTNDDDILKGIILDMCTTKEIEALYQRYTVAQMLNQGMTFAVIEEKTGISSTTISRVSKALKNGIGYRFLFNDKK